MTRPRRWSRTTTVLSLLISVLSTAGRTYTVERGESIQDVLDIVEPGDTVQLEEGHYWEDIETKVDGTADRPITIKGKSGTDRDDVVLRGDGRWVMMYVRHEHYIIKDFTINGKAMSNANDDNYKDAYRNKLIYVLADRRYTTRSGGYRSAIDGLEIKNMLLKNGGAECLRLRYYVTNAKIHDNEIRECGIHDFLFDDGGKTGEGIYIGTSNNQWSDSLMPSSGVDVCRDNHIYDNYIKTKGNEGIQVKEGTVDTLIEGNEVYMQLDENSGGIDCRGNRCTIRDNYIQDAEGCGIRLGGDRTGGTQYGVDNNVYRNKMKNCEYCGIKIGHEDQGVICENEIERPSGDSDYRFARGDGADAYDVFEDCSSYPGPSPSPSPNPSPSPPSPSPTPSGTLGCFTDKRNDRTMDLEFKDNDMTNELCALRCKDEGKTYSGTQYANECWCSNSNDYEDHGTSTSCNMKCKGDDDEYCGGNYAMTVSKTEDYDSPTPTPAGTIGCFRDKRNDRSMSLKFKDNDMTNELCALRCKASGKRYSGTQYAQECWCSNSDDYEDHGTSSSCNMKCSGDDDQYCGGNYAMTVSRTEDYDYGGEFPDGYLGCFKDKRGDRILNEHKWKKSQRMTIDRCISYCEEKNEDYAGLQYGRECWCGSDDDFDRHGGSSDCDMDCNGDDDEICGGNFAVSVYEVDD